MAGVVDFSVKQGGTYRRRFNWRVKDEAGVLTPVPLTGYHAKLQARPRARSSEVLFTLTESSGITLGPADGDILIVIPASTTDDLTGDAVYDLRLTAPGGDVTYLLEGRIVLGLAVTRD